MQHLPGKTFSFNFFIVLAYFYNTFVASHKRKGLFFTSVIRAPLWHFVFIDTFPSVERSEEGKGEAGRRGVRR